MAATPDLPERLDEARRVTTRLAVEAAGARQSWALFEAINGKDAQHRVSMVNAANQLGLGRALPRNHRCPRSRRPTRADAHHRCGQWRQAHPLPGLQALGPGRSARGAHCRCPQLDPRFPPPVSRRRRKNLRCGDCVRERSRSAAVGSSPKGYAATRPQIANETRTGCRFGALARHCGAGDAGSERTASSAAPRI